jgi:hypothetical protein
VLRLLLVDRPSSGSAAALAFSLARVLSHLLIFSMFVPTFLRFCSYEIKEPISVPYYK